jgi:DNA-binding transcriptional MerR regulator
MDKSAEAFRTITEVAENLDLPQHVLRFWETRFSQIKPLKRAGGRRYYRPEDVQLITTIRRLLYDEGFTIRGVQRLLREKGAKAITAGAVPPSMPGGDADAVRERHSADEVNGANGAHAANGLTAEAAALPSRAAPAIDRRALASLLDELIECRRILERALHAPE